MLRPNAQKSLCWQVEVKTEAKVEEKASYPFRKLSDLSDHEMFRV